MMFRALGWFFALLGVFCLMVFGAAWALAEYNKMESIFLWAKVVGGTGGLLIALWLFMDWGSLSNLGKDQTVIRSTTASFAALLALAILIALNVIGARVDKRWDLTETKRYTLSQQSIDIVKGLNQEITVVAFFQTGSPEDGNFRELMENYGSNTTLLKLEYHDPYADPLAAEKEKITSPSGTVIFRTGKSEQRVESKFDEESVTNAIVNAISERQHPVCAVTGHDERGAEDEGSAGGLSSAVSKLEGQNYKVSSISLVEKQPTLEMCEVILLASPRNDLLPAELDRLAAYVAAGGKLIVALDPMEAPNTAADMARYGVVVGNDVAIEGDPNRQMGDGSFVALDESSWAPHPITEKLKGLAVMRLARSVQKGPEIAGLTVTELAHTSEAGWAESNLEVQPIERNEGVDRTGAIGVAAVIEVTDPAALRTTTEVAPALDGTVTAPTITPEAQPAKAAGGKVVVFGDGDLFGNALFLQGINQDVFLNTIAWMAGEKDQLSIRSNEAGKGKLTVTPVGGLIAGIVSLLVMPGITIIGAVGTWLARRRI